MLDIFKKARDNSYGIGAFNVSNLEQLKAIFQAGIGLKSPFMISTSEGESNFIGKRQIRSLMDSYNEEYGLNIPLHFDHGKNFESVKEAIDAGYDSIHFDGSKLSFEENIEITKKVIDYAMEKGVKNIEGELGCLMGSSSIHEEIEIKEESLTNPEQVLDFFEKTGIDSLAVAVGSVHGISKSGVNPNLDLDRIKKIKDKIGDKVFLVLHGSSGTPEEDVAKTIDLGMTKINVNTELRLAYVNALKKSLNDNPEQTTPYKIMPLVVQEVQKVVEEKMKLFKSDNKYEN